MSDGFSSASYSVSNLTFVGWCGIASVAEKSFSFPFFDLRKPYYESRTKTLKCKKWSTHPIALLPNKGEGFSLEVETLANNSYMWFQFSFLPLFVWWFLESNKDWPWMTTVAFFANPHKTLLRVVHFVVATIINFTSTTTTVLKRNEASWTSKKSSRKT